MTKTIPEVLAAHRLDVTMYLGVGQEHLCICGARSDDHEAHQAGEMGAAGYGDVREAGARAWMDGHEQGFWNGRLSQLDIPYGAPIPEIGLEHAKAHNPYRAAVRGEG